MEEFSYKWKRDFGISGRPEIERGGLLLMAKVEEKIGDLQKWKCFRKGGRRKIAKVEEKVCALQERQRFRKSGIETLV